MKKLTLLLLLTISAVHAQNIAPNISTKLIVSDDQITRIVCTAGQISSINYASGTGLQHTVSADKSNIMFYFQKIQQNNSIKSINKSASVFIGCDRQHYLLVITPTKKTPAQSFYLTAPNLSARNNKFNKLTYPAQIINLIKQSRREGFVTLPLPLLINKSPKIHLKNLINLEIQQTAYQEIPGTLFSITQFSITNKTPTLRSLTERQFLSTKLSPHKIIAISLDDHQLTPTKNFTTLHIITERTNDK